MRLTIIPSDGTVCINSVCKNSLDLAPANIPENVHALQWYGDVGEIEYDLDASEEKPKNKRIESLPEWADKCVAIYNEPVPEPPPPPAPTPDQITSQTIATAVGDLQKIAYLTTSEMGQHITPESRQEVADYIHAVANILATAQQKYGTGEAYAPTFPPAPTALPGKPKDDGLEEAPFIKFIVVE